MDDDEPTLLMATFCALHDIEAEEKVEEVVMAEQGKASKTVDLDEPRAQVHLGRVGGEVEQRWYLNSSASNHMTGSKAAFSELDGGMTGLVRRWLEGGDSRLWHHHLPMSERQAPRTDGCVLHLAAVLEHRQHRAAGRAWVRGAGQERGPKDLGPGVEATCQGAALSEPTLLARPNGGAAGVPH